ncbi:CaiB/BaiF CoA-transferase family protein [Amycolatopsis benzoatilytica]|uniref:CaiB/BaiF CoA-transferase family protein n=1 Tax=Amycolatopsis benzoatilytica TaxID=346045 RepID=UPI00037B504A|nr:CoA transferase [Amycolatopsis benzoatilytica]
MTAGKLPLHDVRVVDLGDAVGEAAARLLADLGADTVKVEPPGGSPLRHQTPAVGGVSIPFAVRNANKRAIAADLDVPDDRSRVRQLLAGADIAFVTPRALDQLGIDGLDHLTVVISSPFGRTGPRSGWQATARTLLALNGSLSRSGRPGGEPLLPPESIAEATAAAQAAWTALVGHVLRRRTGRGQVIDLSHQEALVTGLDPAFGAQGSAAAGRSGKVRRGRPPADVYPVYRCADGFVRLCLLSERQWRGMFSWLGEPEEFADPSYRSIAGRVAAADRLEPLISALFAPRVAADLVEDAARRGVPLAQVLTLGDAVASDHFIACGTVANREIAPGLELALPVGFADVDGRRLGIRSPSPAVPSTEDSRWRPREPLPGFGSGAAPFSGIRVLDLGVIVFGAEAGRAFADLGADVIKIENTAFPDGLRQTRRGEAMNASFAWGNRGKRSLGLDLRSAEGRRLFEDLASRSDVVLANFKPGTLDSLGIGYDRLSAVNPRIVVLESSAFSRNGPWANRLGYGPLVRAACGVTSLWKYAPEDVESWDGVTVFPDHVAAKLGALTVAAALLARERTGRGAHLEIAQSDVVLHQFAALAALAGLRSGSAAAGNADTVFACAGDDEWCVIDTRAAEALREVCGAPPDGDLAEYVAKWTAGRAPAEAAEILQEQGIAAAPMVRQPELLDDPQLRARNTFTTMRHPLLDGALPMENVAAPFERLTVPPSRPAPLSGENTVEICEDVLGLPPEETRALLSRQVVHRSVADSA